MSEIEPFYRELGRRLQAAREQAGLTQKEVADRLVPRVTRASVANMESGKQRVLCHTLAALSVLLGVPPGELLTPAAKVPANRPKTSQEAVAIEAELRRKVGRGAAAKILTKLERGSE